MRAVADGKPDAPDQILERWTWRLARATRKVQDRRASGEYPEAKRLLGALANSRGHRHEENAAKLVRTALEQPIQVGAALLASSEGYTPRATKLIDEAREQLGPVAEVALALSDNLPAPKQQASRNRRRRRRKKRGAPAEGAAVVATEAQTDGAAPEAAAGATAETNEQPKPRRNRRRRRPPTPHSDNGASAEAPAEAPAGPASSPEPA